MSYSASLQGCVASLRCSVDLLNSAIGALDQGTTDLPRMGSVLRTTKVFDVVPDADVRRAREAVAGELEPQIVNLLRRADHALQRLDRRKHSLEARAKLQEVRLQRQPREAAATEREHARDLANVRQQRERLELALSRAQMVTTQKQQQLARR
ncbi:DASH complex subunit Spc19 [Dipodascopsis tothii]|uniref:DASH complex subunit Spc19 n=1 Tax=Dipodascopsis tothii TaxID=44089 RepID=UPI0034CE83C6